MAEPCALPAFALSASDCALVQAEGWEGTLARFEHELSQALGFPLPAAVGETTRHAGLLAIRVAPRRFWLVCESAAAAWQYSPDPELGCCLALTQGQVRLRLAGRRVRDVLAKCLALDWSSPAAAPGRGVRTALHRVPVLLLRTGEWECELLVPRGFAESLSGMLLDEAAEFAQAAQASPG
jgi:sarcosine oxidase subunit gamma